MLLKQMIMHPHTLPRRLQSARLWLAFLWLMSDGVYTGSGQELSTTVTNESGTALTVDVDVVYKDASGNTVASPTDAGVYTATAAVNNDTDIKVRASGHPDDPKGTVDRSPQMTRARNIWRPIQTLTLTYDRFCKQ